MKKQLGISVLEVLIGLAVIGLVVAGVAGLSTTAFSNQGTVGMTQEVAQLRNAVKNIYSRQSGYGAASLNSQLIDAKAFPEYLAFDPLTFVVTNSWGGTIAVTGATATYTIGYTAVPKDVCLKHLAQAGAGGLTSVTVNGGLAVAAPVSPSAAQTACSAATNAVVWTAS